MPNRPNPRGFKTKQVTIFYGGWDSLTRHLRGICAGIARGSKHQRASRDFFCYPTKLPDVWVYTSTWTLPRNVETIIGLGPCILYQATGYPNYEKQALPARQQVHDTPRRPRPKRPRGRPRKGSVPSSVGNAEQGKE